MDESTREKVSSKVDVTLDVAAMRMAQLRESTLEDLAVVEADLVFLGGQMDRLEEMRASLSSVIRSLDAGLGIAAAQPRGARAVAMVAWDAIEAGDQRNEDGALTVKEIVDELGRRGWSPDSKNPESAVRAAIRRLREADPRWGLHNGRLYYHDAPRASDDDEEDAES